jgi:hypothetical protein
VSIKKFALGVVCRVTLREGLTGVGNCGNWDGNWDGREVYPIRKIPTHYEQNGPFQTI